MHRNLHYQYVTIAPQPFEEMLNRAFEQLNCVYTPMRLVLFATLSSNSEYVICLNLIQNKVAATFGAEAPVISLVAQTPLDDIGLVVEIHEMEIWTSETISYRRFNDLPYITLRDHSTKRLFLGGVRAKALETSIALQSKELFDTIKTIMEAEEMPINSIVRQWNYIEKITEYQQERQNYQAFNDARSLYYNQTEWPNGFPAATGIGVQWGGVVVDLNATLAYDAYTAILSIDNPLQIAAHAYSQTQLLGKSDEQLSGKTTPKFERAKQVTQYGDGVLYVSGTAAIRGELSLHHIGIEEQAEITLENIQLLIGDHPLCLIRVYLKNSEELASAQKIVRKRYPHLPAVYLQADVCREELLIEIEGISLVTPAKSPLTTHE